MTLTVGSLFSGIGGMDLGFAAAGFDILFQVEINDFCRKVLKTHDHYWPNAAQFVDVRGVARRTGKGWRRYQQLPCVDVLMGGFPCQPHSVAGARLGEADRRNLWPEFRRLIGDLRPRAVLLENVPGITTTLGTSVIADLAALGYVGSCGIISAQQAGAPHLRERWWCVAYAISAGLERWPGVREHARTQREAAERNGEAVADGKINRSLWDQNQPAGARTIQRGRYDYGCYTAVRSQRSTRKTTQPRMGRDAHGLSVGLDGHRWPAPQGIYQHPYEPPRTCASGEPDRAARIEALGNAVVPQIVYALACEIRDVLRQASELKREDGAA